MFVLPSSDIDLVDHFSLNQSRTEEITLKEDFGNEFLTLVDFGKECVFVLDVGYCFLFSATPVLCVCLLGGWGGAGDESQISHTGLMDMNLQSLSHHGDAFGDEDRGFDLLGKSVSSFL